MLRLGHRALSQALSQRFAHPRCQTSLSIAAVNLSWPGPYTKQGLPNMQNKQNRDCLKSSGFDKLEEYLRSDENHSEAAEVDECPPWLTMVKSSDDAEYAVKVLLLSNFPYIWFLLKNESYEQNGLHIMSDTDKKIVVAYGKKTTVEALRTLLTRWLTSRCSVTLPGYPIRFTHYLCDHKLSHIELLPDNRVRLSHCSEEKLEVAARSYLAFARNIYCYAEDGRSVTSESVIGCYREAEKSHSRAGCFVPVVIGEQSEGGVSNLQQELDELAAINDCVDEDVLYGRKPVPFRSDAIARNLLKEQQVILFNALRHVREQDVNIRCEFSCGTFHFYRPGPLHSVVSGLSYLPSSYRSFKSDEFCQSLVDGLPKASSLKLGTGLLKVNDSNRSVYRLLWIIDDDDKMVFKGHSIEVDDSTHLTTWCMVDGRPSIRLSFKRFAQLAFSEEVAAYVKDISIVPGEGVLCPNLQGASFFEFFTYNVSNYVDGDIVISVNELQNTQPPFVNLTKEHIHPFLPVLNQVHISSKYIASVFSRWLDMSNSQPMGSLKEGEIDWRTDEILINCVRQLPKLARVTLSQSDQLYAAKEASRQWRLS